MAKDTKRHQRRKQSIDAAISEVLPAHKGRTKQRRKALGDELPRDGFVFSLEPDGSVRSRSCHRASASGTGSSQRAEDPHTVPEGPTRLQRHRAPGASAPAAATTSPASWPADELRSAVHDGTLQPGQYAPTFADLAGGCDRKVKQTPA